VSLICRGGSRHARQGEENGTSEVKWVLRGDAYPNLQIEKEKKKKHVNGIDRGTKPCYRQRSGRLRMPLQLTNFRFREKGGISPTGIEPGKVDGTTSRKRKEVTRSAKKTLTPQILVRENTRERKKNPDV